jgi:hypothetical protein
MALCENESCGLARVTSDDRIASRPTGSSNRRRRPRYPRRAQVDVDTGVRRGLLCPRRGDYRPAGQTMPRLGRSHGRRTSSLATMNGGIHEKDCTSCDRRDRHRTDGISRAGAVWLRQTGGCGQRRRRTPERVDGPVVL